jgi:outer membrane protein TolC
MMFFRNLNKKFIVLGIFFVTFLSYDSYTQTNSYNLQSAIDYSLKNNRDIKIAALEVTRARAAVSEAYGYALPTVDFSASLSHFIEKAKMPFPDFGALLNNSTYKVLFDEKIIPEDINKYQSMETVLQTFALTNNYEAQFRVSQILFNSAVFTGIGSAGTYLETSKVMFKSQVSKSVLGVQKAFYAALLMKEMYTVINSSFSTFESTVNNVKLLYEQGVVSEYDYLQLKVQLENFKPRVLEAKNGYQLTLDALKLAMSMDKSENLEIQGTYDIAKIDIPELKSSIDNAMKNNLDIQSLEFKRKVDNAFVDLNRSEFWPTLVAFGNATFSGASDDLKFANYNSAIVGLSFSINLYNGGKSDKKVEQQLVNVMKTDEQIKTVRESISLGITSKILDLERIKENINSTVENVNLSERAYKIAELRLKEGTGTQLELINSEQAKREAILNKYKVINDYYNAKFDLDNLLGNLNPEYLKNFNEYLNN